MDKRQKTLTLRGAIATTLLTVLFAAGCSSAPDTKLRLPLGWLDSPAQNTVVKGVVPVAGWALSEDGIDKIAIYVDRSFSEYGKVSGLRPDVIKSYPEFGSTADMEFAVPLDTAAIPTGVHQITARAISKKGAVRDLGTVLVTVEH